MFGFLPKEHCFKGIAGSIALPVNEALGISGYCSRELVTADLADKKFTFSG